MKRKHAIVALVGMTSVALVAVALAAGNWSTAKSKAEGFKREYRI